MNEIGTYLIDEIYQPAKWSPAPFAQHFGIWKENQGLEISEPDFYKRRWDMNGTVLNAISMVNIYKRASRACAIGVDRRKRKKIWIVLKVEIWLVIEIPIQREIEIN